MMGRVLIAGVGNVFNGDDGFGVEVVRCLRNESWPSNVTVRDFGIRGVHLAYELLESVGLLIAIDAMSRGGAPGTLYLFEPDLDDLKSAAHDGAHSMDLPTVFATVRSIGAALPRVLVVGCEPEDISERWGLSATVEQAIQPAIGMIRRIVARTERPVPRVHSEEVES